MKESCNKGQKSPMACTYVSWQMSLLLLLDTILVNLLTVGLLTAGMYTLTNIITRAHVPFTRPHSRCNARSDADPNTNPYPLNAQQSRWLFFVQSVLTILQTSLPLAFQASLERTRASLSCFVRITKFGCFRYHHRISFLCVMSQVCRLSPAGKASSHSSGHPADWEQPWLR